MDEYLNRPKLPPPFIIISYIITILKKIALSCLSCRNPKQNNVNKIGTESVTQNAFCRVLFEEQPAYCMLNLYSLYFFKIYFSLIIFLYIRFLY